MTMRDIFRKDCRISISRFSPHDEDVLRDHLMDLSMTNEVSQLGEAYVNNFVYPDESVNWLPICAEVDGIVVNRNLFDEYNIEIPTDYDSFVEACNAFLKGVELIQCLRIYTIQQRFASCCKWYFD